MTRSEHLAWAKARALEYCATGDASQAFASMTSDLMKHPETMGHKGIDLGARQLLVGTLNTPEEMKKFIEGFG